jgi:hypothetical protein
VGSGSINCNAYSKRLDQTGTVSHDCLSPAAGVFTGKVRTHQRVLPCVRRCLLHTARGRDKRSPYGR